METNILIEKVEKLPAPLKKEVEDFVDFLIFKNESQDKQQLNEKNFSGFGSSKGIFRKMTDDFDGPLNEKPKLKREFGGLKGLVTYIADDFDAPLDDFKDYM